MKDLHIVALSIDKVQTLLTNVIQSHEQEKQQESATLKSIMHTSREISGGFFNEISALFSVAEEEVLLSCSGVYIFTSTLPKDEIENKLNILFLQYYRNSQGQKLLRYDLFPVKEQFDKVQAIQDAKKHMKQSLCLNTILERNRHVLFNFQQVENTAQEKAADTLEKEEMEYPQFAKDLNALFIDKVEKGVITEEEQAKLHDKDKDNANHFRIAVIKADLDGMGDMFKDIKKYDEYRKVSKIINEHISLAGLHEVAKSIGSNREGWLFPFYIAGDDIFFAVEAADMVKGIDVCQGILKKINNRLEPLNKNLSISIGVEITFNRQPIRYYLEMVEQQLRYTKKTSCPERLENFCGGKIAVGSMVFFDIDDEQLKKHRKDLNKKKEVYNLQKLNQIIAVTPVWGFFLKDIDILLYSRQEHGDLLGDPSFFYTLLEKIETGGLSGNDTYYINNVLYHLRPQHIESAHPGIWQAELVLNTGILLQLYQMKDKNPVITLNPETKKRLAAYLRLMILFSDKRFQRFYREKKFEKSPLDDAKIRTAKKYLIRGVQEYLYTQSLEGPLRELFVKRKDSPTSKEDSKGKNKGRGDKGFYYQRLRVEKGMFFKLRNTEKIPIAKAAAMLSIHNKGDEQTDVVEDRGPEDKKERVYRMDFKANEFMELLDKKENRGLWNADYIDALMLFYQYCEISIPFAEKMKKIPGNRRNNGKGKGKGYKGDKSYKKGKGHKNDAYKDKGGNGPYGK